MGVPSYVRRGRRPLEAVSRRRAQAVPLHAGSILCRTLGRYMVFADAGDVSVTPHLALNGFWESWTTVAIGRAVQEGAHAVDVGANYGYFSVLIADAAGEDGRLLAVEPNPRCAELLARTIEVNGFAPRCEVLPSAASSRSATARLSVPLEHFADASVCRAAAAAASVIDVPTISIDEATAGWPRVDFIKIDAEGAEEAIWAGMRCTVRRNPQLTVVMEFKPALYADAAGLLAAIASEGFVLRQIDATGGLQEIPPQEAVREQRGGDCMLFLTRR